MTAHGKRCTVKSGRLCQVVAKSHTVEVSGRLQPLRWGCWLLLGMVPLSLLMGTSMVSSAVKAKGHAINLLTVNYFLSVATSAAIEVSVAAFLVASVPCCYESRLRRNY